MQLYGLVGLNCLALQAYSRRQMSLAGKLLHCIHMQNWNEIARRRSELREMDPWRKMEMLHQGVWCSVVKRNLRDSSSRKLAKLAGVTLAIARFLSTGCKS